jgi:hypothetical protein
MNEGADRDGPPLVVFRLEGWVGAGPAGGPTFDTRGALDQGTSAVHPGPVIVAGMEEAEEKRPSFRFLFFPCA